MADKMSGGSQVMEERIVAAKFDSSDFEKGVDRTVKKLDELKKSLNLKDSGQSIAELGDKTREATESAGKSLEKLTDRFTTFSGMIKQKLLSGIADQVVNVFFRMERAILSFTKSMTFDQISAGLGKYEEALTSVRMIVNSYKTVKNEITGVNEKIHYTQEEAYDSIHALQKYADETSYSMSQMTDAMSKMVAAGVTLDQAEKNVQGIANACAAAGVNAQEASRAFYNLSQAYSSGSLKYTDYRSLELLNMTNENFQEQLLAAGVASGTLKEVKGKNGTTQYKTQKSKTNGKVNAGKTFTRQGLTDSLRYGWADNTVMDALFGNNFFVDVQDFLAAEDQYGEDQWRAFSGEQKTKARKEYLASLKDLDAIEKYINGLSDKSVTKEILKSKTNEQEKKEYLEGLSEQADEINKISKKFGAIRDEDIKNYLNELDDTDENKIHYKQLKTEKERKDFLQKLRKDSDFIKNVKGKEAGYDEAGLQKYIEALDESDERRQKYDKMSAAQKKQYLKDLAKESEALTKLGRKYSDISIESFLAAREARNLQDVINAIGDYVSSKWTKVFENFIGKLNDASNFFTELAEGGIASLFMDPADWVADMSDSFAENGGTEAFRDIILELDSALGNLLGIFNDLSPDASEFGMVLSDIAADVSVTVQNFDHWTEKIKAWFKETSRMETIQSIFANLSGVFRIGARLIVIAFDTIGHALEVVAPVLDAVFAALSKLTEPIGQLGSAENTAPFDKLREAILNVFKPLDLLSGALGGPIEKIGEILGIIGEFFFQGSIDAICTNITLFADVLGFMLEVLGIGSAQQDNGYGILDGIAESIKNLGDACMQGIGFVQEFFNNLFVDLRRLFGLEQEDGAEIKEGGLFANIENFLDASEFLGKAKTWFEQAKTDITTWIKEVPAKIGEFFTGLFYQEDTSKSGKIGKKITGETQYVATPLKLWLDGVVDSVGAFIANIPNYLVKALGKIGDVFVLISSAIFGENEESTKAKKDSKTEKTAEAAALNWAKTLVHNIAEAIKTIPEQVKAFLTETKNRFKKILANVKTWFEESEIGKAIKNFGISIVEGIKNFILNLPETIKNLIKSVGAVGRSIISLVKDLFGGSKVGEEIQNEMENEVKKISLGGILTSIADIGVTIVNEFLSWFSGTDDIQENIDWFIRSIIGFVRDIPGRLWEKAKQIGTDISEVWNYIMSQLVSDGDIKSGDAAGSTDKFAEKHPLLAQTVNSAVSWIKSIPEQFEEAYRGLSRRITSVWNDIETIITRQDRMAEIRNILDDGGTDLRRDDRRALEEEYSRLESTNFEKNHPMIAGIVSSAVSWINSLPDALTNAWDTASSKVSDFWSEFVAFWNKTDRTREDIVKDLNAQGLSDDDYKRLNDELDAFDKATDFEKAHPNLARMLDSSKEWITNIPQNLKSAYDQFCTDWDEFWNAFKTFWNKDPGSDEETEFEQRYPLLAGIVTSIRNWIENIPASLSESFNNIKDDLTRFFNDFSEYWNKLNRLKKLWTASYMIQEQLNNPETSGSDRAMLTKQLAEYEKEYDQLSNTQTNLEIEHPNLANATKEVHQFLGDLPATVSSAFGSATESLQNFWRDLVGAFNGDNLDADTTAESETLGQKIRRKIIEFFIHIPEYISSGINEALRFVNTGFEFLTKKIAGADAEGIVDADSLGNAIETQLGGALDQVKKATENVTDEVNKSENEIAEDAEKQTAKQGFVNGIVNIGTSIWTIITETIPEFIKTGFEYVGHHKDQWIDGLYNIFSNVTGADIPKINLDTVKTSIEEAIKNLPQTIEQAWNNATWTVSHLFGTDKKPLTESMVNFLAAPNISQADKDAVKKSWEEQGYDLSRSVNDPTLWDGFVNIGEQIGGYIAEGIGWAIENIGPLLIKGWNGSISLLDKLFTAVGNFFAGDTDKSVKTVGEAINKEFSKDGQTELAGLMSNLWTSLEHFVLETLPKFIGGTLAKLVSDVPKFFAGIFSGFNDAIAAEAKKQTENQNGNADEASIVENLTTGALTTLQDSLGFITKFLFDENGNLTSGAKILGIIAAIGLVLSAIGDLVQKFKTSQTDFENKNNVVSMFKWMSIVIDLCLGLAALSTSLTEDQYSRLNEMLDRVEGFINRIMDFMLVMKILESGPQLISSIIEGGEACKDLFSGLIGSIFGGVEGVVNREDGEGWFSAFLKGMKGESKDASTAVITANQTAKDAKQIAKATKETAQAQKQINDEKKKQTGISFIDTIFGWAEDIGNAGAGALKAVITGLGVAGFEEVVGTATSDIFSQFVGNFGQVTTELEIFISSISETVGKIEEIEEDISSAIGIFEKVTELFGYIVTIQGYKSNLQEAQDVMTQLTNPVNTLLMAFKGDVHAEELVTALTDLMDLTGKMTEFVDFINKDNTFGEFKWALMSLASIMSFWGATSFGGSFDALTDKQIDDVIKALEKMLSDEGVVKIMSELTPSKLGVNSADVTEGAELLLVFATALTTLSNGLGGFNEDVRTNLVEFFTTMQEIAADVKYNDNVLSFAAQMEILGQGIASFARSIKNEAFSDDDIQLASSALNMVADLSEKISHIGVTFLEKLLTGGTTLPQFSSEMATIGSHLQAFMNYMHPIAEDGSDAKDWSLTNVSTAMYALIQLANAAGRISTGNVDALKSLLDDGGSLGTNILNFMKNILGVYEVLDSDTVTGLKMPKFTYDNLNFDMIFNILDGFSKFAAAIGQLGSLDNLGETLLNLSGYKWNDMLGAQRMKGASGGLITLSTVASNVYAAFKTISEKMKTDEVNIDQVDVFIQTFNDLMNAIGSAYSSIAIKDPDTSSSVNPDRMMTNILTAATNLKNHSEDIFSVIDAIAVYDDGENIERARNVFELVELIGRALSLFGGSMRKSWYDYIDFGQAEHETFEFSGIAESITELQGLAENSGLLVGVVDTLFANLNSALNTNQSLTSADLFGSNMAQTIIQKIQNGLDNMTDAEVPHIRVVLDDTSVTKIKEDIGSIFGTDGTAQINVTGGFTESIQQAFDNSTMVSSISDAVNSIKTEIENHLSTIDDRVLNLQGEITAVQNAFEGMNLYIDGGEAVGKLGPKMAAYIDSDIQLWLNHVSGG